MNNSYMYIVLIIFSLLTTTIKSDNEVQIKATEINKCLTIDPTTTISAYNPKTASQGNFPIAIWETCNNFDTNQQFEYSLSTGQLISNGQCLSSLPISSAFHVNLNTCDTWRFFTGAGSYLFAVDCDVAGLTSTIDPGQQFTYDDSSKTLTSNCAHGLHLGAVGNAVDGYRTFFTDSANTFPSAQILTVGVFMN